MSNKFDELNFLKKIKEDLVKYNYKYGCGFCFITPDGELLSGIDSSFRPFTQERIDNFKQDGLSKIGKVKKIYGPYLVENENFNPDTAKFIIEENDINLVKQKLIKNNDKYAVAFSFLLDNYETFVHQKMSDKPFTPEEIESFKREILNKEKPEKIVGPYIIENPNYKSGNNKNTQASGCLTLLLVPIVLFVLLFMFLH